MNEALREFARTGSSAAFERIVQAHADAVYSQARRELHDLGDRGLADEVAQTVFLSLAKKARRLPAQTVLAGWLFNATRYSCSTARRAEFRRRKRERGAMMMRHEGMQTDTEGDGAWTEAQPLLNDAIAKLGSADRNAILLRYFHGQSLREVGAAMGVSEDAAKQRVSRAVEKLRNWFAGRGLAVPSVTVIGWLGAAVKPAPPALVRSIALAKLPAAMAPQWGWPHWSLVGSKFAAAAAAAVIGTGGVWAVIAVAQATHSDVASPAGNVAQATPASPNAALPGDAPPTTAPTSQPAMMAITVRALIDGRSQLRLKGNTAQWQNFDYSAPGKHGGRDEATIINGVKWHPMWEDSDLSPEVRVKKSLSDSFDHLDPALPAAGMDVTVEKIHVREDASIVQQPSAENDFTTILEFNDDDAGGSAWYEVRLVFTPQK